MSKQTTRPTPFGPCERSEEPLFCVRPGIPIEHVLEHASYVLGTARVLTLAAQDLCTEHQSYLNWASLQFSLQHSQVDPDVWLVSGFWSSEQAMSDYFNSPALVIFTELLNDGVLRSMDFQTFTDASAAHAYGEYLQLAG